MLKRDAARLLVLASLVASLARLLVLASLAASASASEFYYLSASILIRMCIVV